MDINYELSGRDLTLNGLLITPELEEALKKLREGEKFSDKEGKKLFDRVEDVLSFFYALLEKKDSRDETMELRELMLTLMDVKKLLSILSNEK